MIPGWMSAYGGYAIFENSENGQIGGKTIWKCLLGVFKEGEFNVSIAIHKRCSWVTELAISNFVAVTNNFVFTNETPYFLLIFEISIFF